MGASRAVGPPVAALISADAATARHPEPDPARRYGRNVLHPVGSLPPRIYWTRRLAGLGVVLLLALTPLLLLGGGGESAAGDTAAPPAAGAVETPQLQLVPGEELRSTTAAPTSSGSAPATSGAGTSVPSGSVPSGSAPPASGAPTSAPPSSSPPPAAPPAACGDDVIAVTAGSAQPQWPAAGKPVLLMTVTNAGTTACTRDVGLSQQEWGIFDGQTRLWGSNDCQFEPGTDVRALQPGEQVTLQVQWTGMSSDPECAQPRNRLTPGQYQLRAKIGPVQSADFALILT